MIHTTNTDVTQPTPVVVVDHYSGINMASELSQFIEKELKSQDGHDDEHQQLLDDLRSKPLPVGSLPFYKRGAFKKVMVAVGVVVLLVVVLVVAAATEISEVGERGSLFSSLLFCSVFSYRNAITLYI